MLIFFGIYSSTAFKNFYLQSTSDALKSRTFIIKDELTKLKLDSSPLETKKKTKDKLSDERITIENSGKKLIADSRKTPAAMENHKERPEIIEAFNGNTGSSIRYSSTLKSDLMYIAIPWPE